MHFKFLNSDSEALPMASPHHGSASAPQAAHRTPDQFAPGWKKRTRSSNLDSTESASGRSDESRRCALSAASESGRKVGSLGTYWSQWSDMTASLEAEGPKPAGRARCCRIVECNVADGWRSARSNRHGGNKISTPASTMNPLPLPGFEAFAAAGQFE